MPGAGLTSRRAGQAGSDTLALKPYWGNLPVRHFRGGDGNVGIMRSPVRAIALPDRDDCVLAHKRLRERRLRPRRFWYGTLTFLRMSWYSASVEGNPWILRSRKSSAKGP